MNCLPRPALIAFATLALGPLAGGGHLILSRDSGYFALNLETGEETFLARGSLDAVVNLSLQVNAGVAYESGEIRDDVYGVSATDLETGATRTYVAPGGFISHLGGFHDGKLILIRNTSYYALDLETGMEGLLARGPLDRTSNYSVEIMSGNLYQGGTIRDRHAVGATNLETGATRIYIAPGGFFSHFEGFHNGKLVLVRGTSYFGLDLESGTEEFLGTGSLDNLANWSLEVHNGVVYQGGEIGEEDAISATDLATGATRDYIPPGGFFRNFEGVFDSRVRIGLADPSSAAEDAGPVFRAVLTRFGCIDTSQTVNFTLAGSATVGADYSLGGATASSVVFPEGEARATVSFETSVDNVAEEDESIVITLQPGDGYTIAEDQSVAIATIVNDDFSPVAVSDPVYGVVEDGSLTISSELGVLANDTDLDDGDGPGNLTTHLEDDVKHGILILEAEGGFTYTPDPDYFGSDSFSYRASDGTNFSQLVLVEMEVTELVDLALDASTNREIVGAPGSVTHTISVRNEGPSDSTAAVLDFSSEIPAGVTPGAPVVSTGTVSGTRWFFELPEGETATLQITYAVAASAPGGIDLIATSATIASNHQPLTNAADDAASIANGIISPESVGVLVAGPPSLDLQSALFTQKVTITNNNELSLSGFRVVVESLPPDVVAYNGHGTNEGGSPFVDSDRDLGPGESVSLTFEFFRPTGDATLVPAFSVESVYTENPPRPAAGPAGAELDRVLVLENSDTLLEFASIPGTTYAIEYSPDMQNWRRVVPTITAPANRTQWIDSGPPKTSSHPSMAAARYYRVVTLANGAGGTE